MSISTRLEATHTEFFPSAMPTQVSIIGSTDGRLESHEFAALYFAATRLAKLFKARYVDRKSFEPNPGQYWIPSSTLVPSAAEALGIVDACQLWGGIVPFEFVATKLVSHPLWGPPGAAPSGWVPIDGLEQCTLPGYSVFRHEDALAAGVDLLRGGRVRIKLPHGRGGQDQHVVVDEKQLSAWLKALPDRMLRRGIVLERDLARSVTYSVGSSELPGDHAISYVGTQRTITTPTDTPAYGGSRLEVIRGGLEVLAAGLDDGERLSAVCAARCYDDIVRSAYDVVASRCNYDVIAGVDHEGQRHLGVLEQSWRFGGASTAELLAIERFAAEPTRQQVVAESVETYLDDPLPSGSSIFWHGTGNSPRKYARIVD